MNDQQSGAAIAVRDNAAAIVKPVPVPRDLQEIGVRLGADESGLRVVYLPAELRERVNIVNPTTSYVQADPNWTPGISLVTIDVERDTYNVAGKRGLAKQALETIAKAAGVLYTRTSRVPANELQPGERYAYRATVGFRRSDGTIDEITRERGWNEEVERAKIEDSVRTATNRDGGARFATPEAQAAEIRKRWLAELEFGPAKVESKAINRALRAGLSIPTALRPQDAAKPFLVIGYNFTPDYTDPEIKRALVAVGLNAQAAIYGDRTVSDEVPEIAAADIPARPALEPGETVDPQTGEITDTARDGAPDVAGAQAASSSGGSVEHGDDEQARGGDHPGSASSAAAGSSAEPDLETAAAPAMRVPEKAIDEAGDTVVHVKEDPETKAVIDTKTVREIAGAGEAGRRWFAWAAESVDDARWNTIALYLEHREPELWAAVAPLRSQQAA